MVYGMARLGKGTLGTQCRVGNYIVRLARTELPYQVETTHRPTLPYFGYHGGDYSAG